MIANFELLLQLQEAEIITFRESQNLRMSVWLLRPSLAAGPRAALPLIKLCPCCSCPRPKVGGANKPPHRWPRTSASAAASIGRTRGGGAATVRASSSMH